MQRIFSALGLGFATLLLASCMQIQEQRTDPQPDIPPAVSGSGEEILEPGDVPAPLPENPVPPAGSGSAVQERITPNGDLELGSVSAPGFSLFTNHACAYCAEFTRDYLPRLQRDFLEKGLLRISISFVPFKKYPNSSTEAAAVLCAGKQGKGLLMHQALFDLKVRTRDGVLKLAKEKGLKANEFTACLDAQETKNTVAAGEQLAAQKRITLVPALDAGDEIKTGLPGYADLRGRLEQMITR